jgi:hypothetical protein
VINRWNQCILSHCLLIDPRFYTCGCTFMEAKFQKFSNIIYLNIRQSGMPNPSNELPHRQIKHLFLKRVIDITSSKFHQPADDKAQGETIPFYTRPVASPRFAVSSASQDWQARPHRERRNRGQQGRRAAASVRGGGAAWPATTAGTSTRTRQRWRTRRRPRGIRRSGGGTHTIRDETGKPI